MFQHIRVFGADGIESVVLRGDRNDLLRAAAARSPVDKGKLHTNGRVKIVEKVAPVFKNGGLIVCLRKLVVDVVVGDALGVFLFRNLADTVRVHGKIRYGLLRSVRLSVALCRLDQGGDFLFFGAGELTPVFCVFCVCR